MRVLEDWCPPFPGFFLYYPSRAQSSAPLRLFIEAVRELTSKRPAKARPKTT